MIFTLYLLLCCWILFKWNVKDLSFPIIGSLFLLRLIVGCLNGYLNLYYFKVSDSKAFQEQGLVEYQLLKTHPKEYFVNIFRDTHHNSYGGFNAISNSYWNDLKNNIMVKIVSILDIFSQGGYYTNILLYNFFTFLASILLFKYFIKKFPASKKAIIFSVFLLPTAIFYSSALHKEGLLFNCLIVIFYGVDKLFNNSRRWWLIVISISVALLFTLLLRNYVFLILLGSLFCYLIARYTRLKTWGVFVIGYSIFIILFFTSATITFGKIDLPQLMVERQSKFVELSLTANTSIHTVLLQPTFLSYAKNLPVAINHAFFRPYLFEGYSIFIKLLSLENLFCLVVIILFLFKRKKEIDKPFFLLLLFFSLTMMLIIGYTVPVIATIIRYKSIYLPFLITPIICSTNWEYYKSLMSRWYLAFTTRKV